MPNPMNWRQHPKEQIAAVSGSINEVGWIAPVIVNETTSHVVDGHARIAEAIARGEPTVPVAYVRLTEDQERLALATFDPIAVMAGTDQKMLDDLLAGLSVTDGGLSDLLASLASEQPKHLNDDDADLPPPAEPITKSGDLWLMGEHRLLCGDSTNAENVARLMDGEKARMGFTSPPYNANMFLHDGPRNLPSYMHRDADNLPPDAYHVLVTSALRLALGAIADGFLFVNLSYSTNARAAYIGIVEHFAEALWETIVWKKKGMPVPSGLTRDAELIFVFGVGDHQHLNATYETESNVWDISNTGVQDWEHHRAVFPIGLPSRGISLASQPGEIVIESFAGTGTTLIAAEQLGRKCYAMEIEPAYCDVSVRRWEHVTGKQAQRG